MNFYLLPKLHAPALCAHKARALRWQSCRQEGVAARRGQRVGCFSQPRPNLIASPSTRQSAPSAPSRFGGSCGFDVLPPPFEPGARPRSCSMTGSIFGWRCAMRSSSSVWSSGAKRFGGKAIASAHARSSKSAASVLLKKATPEAILRRRPRAHVTLACQFHKSASRGGDQAEGSKREGYLCGQTQRWGKEACWVSGRADGRASR
eukprot:1544087-Pleurochrysis_carterae.AAC.2